MFLQEGSTEAEQLETGIPELTTKAQQLEQQLQAQEQVLQQLQEGVRGEVEQHTQALQEVRRQLAPWDQQISQVQSRLAVSTAEQDMLQKSHLDAKQRLQVCFITQHSSSVVEMCCALLWYHVLYHIFCDPGLPCTTVICPALRHPALT